MKKTILICTDLSEGSSLVVQKGLELASSIESTAHILIVVNQVINYFPTEVQFPFNDQWDIYLNLANSKIKKSQTDNPNHTIIPLTKIGEPENVIIDTIEEIKPKYVVLGTHGFTGLSHLLMGSTAEYVIRHSTVPLLIIPFNKEKH